MDAAAKKTVIKVIDIEDDVEELNDIEAAKEVAGAEDVSLDFANDFSEGLEAEQEE